MVDEVLEVLEWNFEGGWGVGRNGNGKKGDIPQNYVQPLKLQATNGLGNNHNSYIYMYHSKKIDKEEERPTT